MRLKQIVIKSIASGIAISIGGTVYLSCDNKYIGAVLFGLGLFIILNFDRFLYTGKIGYILENDLRYSYNMMIVWIGNYIGTVISSMLLRHTRIASDIVPKAEKLAMNKLTDDNISLFVLAFFCGVLMYIAAEGKRRIKNNLGKNIATFLPVTVFILCGFEHCVANMFYFSLSDIWTMRMIVCLLIMTAGNTVGGIICNILTK